MKKRNLLILSFLAVSSTAFSYNSNYDSNKIAVGSSADMDGAADLVTVSFKAKKFIDNAINDLSHNDLSHVDEYLAKAKREAKGNAAAIAKLDGAKRNIQQAHNANNPSSRTHNINTTLAILSGFVAAGAAPADFIADGVKKDIDSWRMGW